MKIACLHTMASNVPVFDAYRGDDVEVVHVVRSDLLADAERAGGMTADIAAAAVATLLQLAGEADAVLLTCSTIGPAADEAARRSDVPILRADQSLAEESVASGGPVLVLCAVATTIEPSRRLFEMAAERTGAPIEMRVVPDAWPAFKRGDLAGYHRLIADFADQAFQNGAATIALAQASMAAAAGLCRVASPLTSPEISMAKVQVNAAARDTAVIP